MRYLRRVFHYVGNRGIVLGLLGGIWCLTALGLVVEPVRRNALLHESLPLWLRFTFWCIPGVAAIVSVAARQLDPIAWMLLIVPPTIHLLSYSLGWILGTYPAGWRGACMYFAVVLLVNRCAAGLDRAAPWDGRERRKWMTEPQ